MIQDKTLQRDPEFHAKMVVGTEARQVFVCFYTNREYRVPTACNGSRLQPHTHPFLSVTFGNTMRFSHSRIQKLSEGFHFSSGCQTQARWNPINYATEHIVHLKREAIGHIICTVIWEDIFFSFYPVDHAGTPVCVLESFATAV